MYTTYNGFTTSTTPILPASEVHPSLLFSNSEITNIKAKYTTGYYAAVWSRITTNINNYRSKTASAQDENDRPRMALYCAFAWLMNNDATAKQKAIDALLIAFDNVPRTTTATDFGGNYDEIYRATWLQNYCLAYDWIHSQLTPTQNTTIREKLLYETSILRNHMVDSTRYSPRPHNHRSKPAYAIGTAALTFSSDSRASGWLQFALTQINTVTKYQFNSEGIYREGGHYDLYNAVNAIPFLWQYKIAAGVDLFPIYKPMFEWPLKVRMVHGWIPPFEDSFLKPIPTHMGAKAYKTTTTDLNPDATLAQLLQWHYFNTSIFDINYTGATNDVCWDVLEYLFYDDSILQSAPTVSASINMDGGQTIFRKSWNYNDKSNRYLIFHGVAEADNHNHPDQLSFVIEAENSIMATTCGYGPAGASDVKRNSWYLTPVANNGIMVDSTAPLDSVVNFTPVSRHFINGTNYNYIEKEIGFANGAKWKRGISFPHKNYWIVNDIVKSNVSRTSIMTLHSRGTLSINGINASWQTVSDIYGQAALFDTYNVTSGSNSLQSRTGYFSPFWGEEETVNYISLSNRDTVSMFASVLFPLAAGASKPVVTNSKGSGYHYLTVNYNDTTDYHVFKKNNSNTIVSGITTDALYMWFSLTGTNVNSFAVTEGSSIIRNGITWFNSSIPVTLQCSYNNFTANISSDSINTSVQYTLKLPFPAAQLSQLNYNGYIGNYSVAGDSTITFNTLSVLPVELKNFQGILIDEHNIELKWKTSSEINNYGFEIERSLNGSAFERIAFIRGNGSSNQENTYGYIDKSINSTGNYKYRLKQIDINSNYKYSNEISIYKYAPIENCLYQNYPNPFNPETKISYAIAGNNEQHVKLKVYDVLGRVTATLIDALQSPGSYNVYFSPQFFNNGNLASGIYMYSLEAGNYKAIKKMIFIK